MMNPMFFIIMQGKKMEKKNLVKIRSTPLTPQPSSYNSTTFTIIDEGSSVSGHMLGSVVRERVAKISLSWNYLTKDEWENINKLFMTNSSGKNDGNGSQIINKVEFFDQSEGIYRICEMYISDRSAGIWRLDKNNDVVGWTGCSLELTEV